MTDHSLDDVRQLQTQQQENQALVLPHPSCKPFAIVYDGDQRKPMGSDLVSQARAMKQQATALKQAGDGLTAPCPTLGNLPCLSSTTGLRSCYRAVQARLIDTGDHS